jgi:hypothetical protein
MSLIDPKVAQQKGVRATQAFIKAAQERAAQERAQAAEFKAKTRAAVELAARQCPPTPAVWKSPKP